MNTTIPIKLKKLSKSNFFSYLRKKIFVDFYILFRMDKKNFFDRVLKVEHGKGGNRGLDGDGNTDLIFIDICYQILYYDYYCERILGRVIKKH